MTDEPNGELEVLALRVEAERSPGTAVERRVLARLEASLPHPDTGEPVARRGPATGLTRSGLLLSGVFALGGGAALALHAALDRSPAPRVVFVDRAPSLLEPSAWAQGRSAREAAPAPLGPPSESSEPTRSRRQARGAATGAMPNPPPAPADTPAVEGGTLADEQQLLDAGRSALSRLDWDAVLRLTHAHSKRFPSGALREEREALAIKALWGARRDVEADARLLEFELRFPRSPLLPALRLARSRAQ